MFIIFCLRKCGTANRLILKLLKDRKTLLSISLSLFSGIPSSLTSGFAARPPGRTPWIDLFAILSIKSETTFNSMNFPPNKLLPFWTEKIKPSSPTLWHTFKMVSSKSSWSKSSLFRMLWWTRRTLILSSATSSSNPELKNWKII